MNLESHKNQALVFHGMKGHSILIINVLALCYLVLISKEEIGEKNVRGPQKSNPLSIVQDIPVIEYNLYIFQYVNHTVNHSMIYNIFTSFLYNK